MKAQAKTVSLRRGKFKVKLWTAGSGPPLLYLHGVTGLTGWPSWLNSLAETHHVVAPQLPGFGASTGLDTLADFLDLSIYTMELMEALRMESPAIMGHWIGGTIAAEVAALSPASVSKLVLVAPSGLFNDQDPGVDIFAVTEGEMLQALWHDPEAAMKRGLHGRPRTTQAKMRAFLDRTKALSASGKYLWPIPDKGLKKRAHRIKAPTLLIWGASDKIVPPSYGPMFKNLIRSSRLATIPRSGHLPMLEQPQRFIGAVRGFLA